MACLAGCSWSDVGLGVYVAWGSYGKGGLVCGVQTVACNDH